MAKQRDEDDDRDDDRPKRRRDQDDDRPKSRRDEDEDPPKSRRNRDEDEDPPKSRRNRDEDEDPPKSRRNRDEEDDRPRARRRDSDDDDDDDRLSTRRKKAPSGERKSNEDLRMIAIYQKAIIFSILANLLCMLGVYFGPLGMKLILAVVSILVGITGTVFVFLMATKAYSVGVGVVLALLTFLPGVLPYILLAMGVFHPILGFSPLLGIVMLVVINQRATGIMQEHGIRVGLLGARMSDLN